MAILLFFYYPRNSGPLDWAPIHMSFEEVAVHAGHKVLMEADDTSAPIVSNRQGILGQHLRPLLIHLLIISIIIFVTY